MAMLKKEKLFHVIETILTTESRSVSLELRRTDALCQTLIVLVYKSLHRLAPPYLSDDCQLVTDVGRRHSAPPIC